MAINIGGEGTKASKLLSPKEVGLLLAKQGGRRGLEGLQGREAESEEEGVQRERSMVAMKEEIRKGPWTEQEDFQLVCYIGLFGERRWDFIAKVSGLNRSGKSCRLRWVNYLHPGLKRGRMTPQEERLVLELHARWGNRWSRIARRLPGRTDNEIKNYWRTHMRKKAQERKRNPSPSLSSSSSSSSLFSLSVGKPVIQENLENHLLNGTGGGIALTTGFGASTDESVKGYTMDQIWKEIDTSESASGLSFQEYNDEACKSYCPPMPSPMWDYSCDSLWKMDEEEFKTEPLVFNYQPGIDN